MTKTSCSVNTCYFSKPSRHRFPNPKKDIHRFKKWLLLVGNKELLKRSPDEVYGKCRVCADHFVVGDFGPNNVLLSTAIPSMKLPCPLNIQEYPQIEISMELCDQQLVEYQQEKNMQICSSTRAPVEPVVGPSGVQQITDAVVLSPRNYWDRRHK